jgi:hypothetical protein
LVYYIYGQIYTRPVRSNKKPQQTPEDPQPPFNPSIKCCSNTINGGATQVFQDIVQKCDIKDGGGGGTPTGGGGTPTGGGGTPTGGGIKDDTNKANTSTTTDTNRTKIIIIITIIVLFLLGVGTAAALYYYYMK